MILDDLECQNRGFMDFLATLGCETHFKSGLHRNQLRQTFSDKRHMKFSTLNVDFDGPSLDFLGSKKPAHEGIRERYPVKVNVIPLLASLS